MASTKGTVMNLAGRIGVALATAMAAYMIFNAVQAWASADAFAVRLGLPLASMEAEGWVRIYALRAAFIALLLAGLVLARQWRALFLFAVAALVMPLGDAWLTYNAGASGPTYVRHIVIAGVVGIMAVLLAQAAKSAKD